MVNRWTRHHLKGLSALYFARSATNFLNWGNGIQSHQLRWVRQHLFIPPTSFFLRMLFLNLSPALNDLSRSTPPTLYSYSFQAAIVLGTPRNLIGMHGNVLEVLFSILRLATPILTCLETSLKTSILEAGLKLWRTIMRCALALIILRVLSQCSVLTLPKSTLKRDSKQVGFFGQS